MSGLSLPPNAHHLGAQSVEVTLFEIYPAWQLEALPGAPIDGPFDVHVRLVLPKHQRAVLLPCSIHALRATVRQFEKVSDARATDGN